MRVDGLGDRFGGLERGLESFRSEVKREFDETRAMIRLSYGELERRIVGLETGVKSLEGRMEHVEERLRS